MVDPQQGRELVDAAHAYAKRGWRVIQLYGLGPDGLTCHCRRGRACGRDAGKHPMDNEWQNTPPMSAADIEAAWEKTPRANIGLVTGEPSSVWVVDIDPEHDGLKAWEALRAEHGHAPRTYTVKTGGGGWHFYYQLPEGVDLRNSAGRVGQGIDVRANGGYVVAPPSRSSKGAYTVAADAAVVAAPDWLVEAARKPDPVNPVVTSDETPDRSDIPAEEQRRLDRYAEQIVRLELGRLDELKTKGWTGPPWNITTHAVACTLIELANCGWSVYTMRQAYADLFERAPRDPGFDDVVVNKIFESARSTIGNKARAVPPKPAPRNDDDWLSEGIPTADPTPAGGGVAKPAGRKPGEPITLRAWSDLGLARRLFDLYGERLRWSESAEKWIVYLDGRWLIDRRKVAHGLAQEMIEGLVDRELTYYSADKVDPDDKMSPREEFVKWAKGCQASARISAALKEGSGLPEMQVALESFDQDPDLLNVLNGVVDLCTGELLPHDPALMLMQQAMVEYDPEALAPRWLAYLERCQPDHEMRTYLQRIIGYSLTGHVGEQAFFIHWGAQGANGKSVMLDVVLGIVGDYGDTVARGALTANQNEQHPTAVARMIGKRWLQLSESAKGQRLDEELIRQLTGGDKMTARFMGKDFFTFDFLGKIQYITNHLPRLSDANATWRRVHLIEWPVNIPKDEQDPDLASKILAEERAGVLAWMVRGALAWREQRLAPPPQSRLALEEYREDQDEFADFLLEKISPAPDGLEHQTKTPMSELYGAYQNWAFTKGIRTPMREADFSRALAERNYKRYRTGRERGFRGIVVTPVTEKEFQL